MPKARLNKLLFESVREITGFVWSSVINILFTVGYIVLLIFIPLDTGFEFLLAFSGYFLLLGAGNGSVITALLGIPAMFYLFYLVMSFFMGPYTSVFFAGLLFSCVGALLNEKLEGELEIFSTADVFTILGTVLFVISLMLIILYCLTTAFYIVTVLVLLIFVEPPLNQTIAGGLSFIFFVGSIVMYCKYESDDY